MAKLKTKIYLVTMNDQAKTKRLIAATNPQAARNYACKDVTAKMATAYELYQLKLKVENAPEEQEHAQSAIPMTAAGKPLRQEGWPLDDDDIRYASQA